MAQCNNKTNVIDFLTKSTVTQEEIDDIKQYLKDIKDDSNINFDSWVNEIMNDPDNIWFDKKRLEEVLSLINQVKYPGTLENESPKPEKEMPSEPLDQSDIQQGVFLDDYWHNAEAKNSYKTNTKLQFVSNILLDSKNKCFRSSSSENVVKGLNNYKYTLYNNIVDFLKFLQKENLNWFTQYDVVNKALNNVSTNIELSDEDIDTLVKNVSDIFKYNGDLINDYIISQYKIKDNLQSGLYKNILNAYDNYVTLSNFDNMLKYTIDFINVDYDNPDRYTLNYGTNVKRSFVTDDDYDYSKELGAIPQLLIQVSPLYDMNDTNLGLMDVQRFYAIYNSIRAKQTSPEYNTKLQDINRNNVNFIQLIRNQFSQLYGEKTLYDILHKLKTKTVGELIGYFKQNNSSKIIPIIFYTLDLLNKNADRQSTEANYIHSIYNNFFNPANAESLINYHYNTTNKQNINYDYYSHLIQLLRSTEKLDITEINTNDPSSQGIETRDISNNTKNAAKQNRLYDIQATINTNINVSVPTDEQNPIGYTCNKIIDNIASKIEFEDNKLSITLPKGTKIIYSPGKNNFSVTNMNDIDLKNIAQKVLNSTKINTFDKANKQKYFRLAAHILYNYCLSKQIVLNNPNCTKQEFLQQARNISGFESTIKAPNILQLPPITDSKLIPDLESLLQEENKAQGYTEVASSNKDLQGNTITTTTISQLLSKFPEMYQQIKDSIPVDENGEKHFPVSDFVLPSLYNNISVLRDAKGKDGTVKKATNFNFNEFFTSTFLLGFANGRSAKNNMWFLPCPISDKPKIPLVNLNTTKQVPTNILNQINADTEQKLPAGTQYCKLNSDAVKSVIRHSFGIYYTEMYTNIRNSYVELYNANEDYLNNNYKLADGSEITSIDFDNNFEQFNNLVKKDGTILTNDDKQNLFHELIYNAQQLNPNFELTETSFYNWVKDKDKNIHLKVNPLLVQQYILYNKDINIDIEKYGLTPSDIDEKQFWDTKENQLVSDLLRNNFKLPLYDSNGVLRKDEGSNYLNKQTAWNKNHKLVLAKLNRGTEISKSITSLNQFKYDIPEYNLVQDYFYGDKSNYRISDTQEQEILDSIKPEYCNIDSPEFKFEHFITAVNILSKAKFDNELRKTMQSALVRYQISNLQSHPKEKQAILTSFAESAKGYNSTEDYIANQIADYINIQPDKREQFITNYINKNFSNLVSSQDRENKQLSFYLNQHYNDIPDLTNEFNQTFKINQDKLDKIKKDSELETNKAKNEYINNQIKKTNINFNNRVNVFRYDKLYTLEINPELKLFNSWDYLIGQEFLDTTVGSFINHPCKAFLKGADVHVQMVSAEANIAQVKRNVMEASPVHQLHTEALNGMGYKLHIAIVDDLYNEGFNVSGVYDDKAMTTTDGITFTNGAFAILENNSLQSEAVGIDKKDFGTYYNPKTGLGFVLKTSGDAVTNERIRRSHRGFDDNGKYTDEGTLGNLNRVMNDTIKWNQEIQYLYVDDKTIKSTDNFKYIDWTHAFDNKELPLKDVYVYIPGTDTFEHRTNFSVNELGQTQYSYAVVDENLKVLKDVDMRVIKTNTNNDNLNGSTSEALNVNGCIDSNYQLWKYAFGGEYSASVNEFGKLSIHNDNTSFENLVVAMNNVGIQKYPNEPVTTTEDINQVLKNASLAYVATIGAVKQGASNTNSSELYKDPNYKATYMTVNAFNWGIQLNSEHHANDSLLSLMTQVVNALGARGYTQQEADSVYRALHNVAVEKMRGMFQSIITGDDTKLRDIAADLIINSLKNSTSTDGNLLQSIVDKVLTSDPNTLGYARINKKIPISLFTSKIVSIITSALTTKGIKLKFSGSMCVLCPSDGQYLLFNGKTSEYYIQHPQEFIQDVQKSKTNFIQGSQMQIEHYYSIVDKDGIEVNLNDLFPKYTKYINKNAIKFANPYVYWDIKDALRNNPSYQLRENIEVGRDLSSYGCTFEAIGPDGKKHLFSLWDLDVIKQLYDDPKNKKLYAELQYNLNSIAGKSNTHIQIDADGKVNKTQDNFTVKIGNIEYNVLPETVDEQAYELIAPKIYQETFGLRTGDDLADIQKLGYKFFIKRIIEQSNAKVLMNNDYDISLNTLSGHNYYIKYDDGHSLLNLDGYVKKDIRFVKGADDIYYRLDKNNNQMYSIPVVDDKPAISIYTKNNNEIIVTSDPKYFLDSLTYSNLNINLDLDNFNENKFQNLLDQVQNSTNESAIAYSNSIYDEDATEIIRNIQFLNKGKSELQTSLINLVDTNVDINYNSFKKLLQSLTNIYTEDQINKLWKFAQPIIRNAKETYTSFNESLKFIASRTPAQSQQSFMPMKIVAFTNSGLNSAYVSRWQIWLQGSDFDIDKVSLLGKEIYKGKLVKWSNIQSLLNSDYYAQTKDLDFPTGEALSVDENNTDDAEIEEILQKYKYYPINNNIKKVKGIVDEVISTAYEAGNMKNFNSFLHEITNMINDGRTIPNTDLGKFLVELINRHNLTFTKGNKHLISSALKNYIASMMYNCTSSPSNLIQAQQALDDAKKIVTSLTGSNNPTFTKLSAMNKTVDPGAASSKIQQLLLNLSGKDDIAAVASAMKNFEAFSQCYCKLAAEGDSKLLSNKVIAGKQIKLLANTFSFVHDDRLPELNEALEQVDNIEDAFIVLSALLALATDNAKNPQLAMINGNPNMINFYTSAVMLGIPFTTVVKIMLSKTGLAIASLTSGNIILDQKGTETADKAIKYIEQGPNIPDNIYNKIKLILTKSGYINNNTQDNTIKAIMKNPYVATIVLHLLQINNFSNASENSKTPVEILNLLIDKYSYDVYVLKNNTEASESDKNKAEATLTRYKDFRKKIFQGEFVDLTQDAEYNQLFNLITAKEPTTDFVQSKKDTAKLYNFIEEYSEYLQLKKNLSKDIINIENIDGTITKINPIQTLKAISNFTAEVTFMNMASKLNQGIPNKTEDLLNYVVEFENQIQLRLNKSGRDINKLSEKIDEIINDGNLKNFKDDKKYGLAKAFVDLVTLNRKYGFNEFDLNLNKFSFDEQYQQAAIKAYEAIKYIVNVPKIILNTPHYFGYLKLTSASYQISKNISEIFKSTEFIQQLLKDHPVYDAKRKLDRYKKIQQYLQEKLNEEFLRGYIQKLSFDNVEDEWMPKHYFTDDGTIKSLDNTGFSVISFNTEAGRKTFKLWMDEVVFPNLIKYYPSDFTNNLGRVNYTLNSDHSSSVNRKLNIATNPIQPQEIIDFSKAKVALNDLQNKKIKGLNGKATTFSNLIYLYNIIAYKNSNIQGSFTSIYQDQAAQQLGTDQLIGQHYAFISTIDSDSGLFYGLDTNDLDQNLIANIKDEILRYIAPVTNVYALKDSNLEYAWILDDYNKYILVQKSEGTGMPAEYEDEYDNEQDNDDEDENYNTASISARILEAGYNQVGEVQHNSEFVKLVSTNTDFQTFSEDGSHKIIHIGNNYRIMRGRNKVASFQFENNKFTAKDDMSKEDLDKITSGINIANKNNDIDINQLFKNIDAYETNRDENNKCGK